MNIYLFSRANCAINVDNIVNILCEPNESDGNYHISDKNNSYLIVNPHIILSGTTILSSLSCLRKYLFFSISIFEYVNLKLLRSTLAWKFRDGTGSNSHMLLGNLLHTLFQDAIRTSKFTKVELNELLSVLIKRKLIVNQVFEANIQMDSLVQEAIEYVDSIEKWLREHVKVKPMLTKNNFFTNNSKPSFSATNKDNFQVLNVQDIEESIWSPKYGIKGKLDLTLQIEKHKEMASKKQKTIEIDTIPVELKSGRSTFSVEHEGQVMLYALLNKEKRKDNDYGLLLYLKDSKMKFIKATQSNLKGLIQLRNDLVHFISSNNLPSFKEEERFCSKCSLLTVCSLFNDNSYLNKKIKYETKIDLYAKSISHLTENHKNYFFKWYKMLDHEFQNDKQFDAGDLIWNKSLNELETIGFTVSNLKLCSSQSSVNDLIDNNIASFLPFEFRRDNNNK